MSLKRTLKRFTPPSSPTFHHFEETTYKRFDELERLLREQNAELERISAENRELNHELSQKIVILQKQLAIYGEVLLQDPPGADSFETRKQLFRRLPPATGQLRECQLVNARLMQALHNLCQEHHLEYWLSDGSLLGAYTRGGPIPWDDDIDICIPRQSLEKLMEVLRDDPDFQVTVVYDRCALCIQRRFCSRNVNLPAFIDLYAWDYATDYTPEKDQRLHQMRTELSNELERTALPYWNEKCLLFDPSSGYNITGLNPVSGHQPLPPDQQDAAKVKHETAKIKQIFQKYTDQAHAEGIFCDRKTATGYAYAFDNLICDLPDRRMLLDQKLIYPTRKLSYENFGVVCPHNPEAFLNSLYAHWPFIPNNASLLDGKHIKNSVLSRPEVKQAMQDFLA